MPTFVTPHSPPTTTIRTVRQQPTSTPLPVDATRIAQRLTALNTYQMKNLDIARGYEARDVVAIEEANSSPETKLRPPPEYEVVESWLIDICTATAKRLNEGSTFSEGEILVLVDPPNAHNNNDQARPTFYALRLLEKGPDRLVIDFHGSRAMVDFSVSTLKDIVQPFAPNN